MKPAWDGLGSDYQASSSVIIADVDCTVEEELCSAHEVRGYPTIKYYKDGDKKGEDYQGGRDAASLKSFVEETLEVKCQVADQEKCTDKEQTYIEKMKAKSKDEIVTAFDRLDKMKGSSMKPDLKQWLTCSEILDLDRFTISKLSFLVDSRKFGSRITRASFPRDSTMSNYMNHNW